jgi:hypothetical protein
MTKPISPLRQRMLDDMTFRNMSPNTQKVYSYAVANFSAFHGRSPDKLGVEDVRACGSAGQARTGRARSRATSGR